MVPMPPLGMPMVSLRVIMTTLAPMTFSLFISSLSSSIAISPLALFRNSLSCAVTFSLIDNLPSTIHFLSSKGLIYIIPFFIGLVFQSQSSQPSLYQIQCLLSLEKQISLVRGLLASAPKRL
ncbi:hypothetical protein AMTRI_Chr03g143140 [Amborella trichopoda]